MLNALDWLELRLPLLERLRWATARERARFVFSGCELGRNVLVHGGLSVERQGALRVGDRCVFAGGPFRTQLRVGRDASLVFGQRCCLNYGCQLDVRHSVRMGSGCMFGSYVRITDAPSTPVVLGDDVWVAHGAVIEPGVTVGDGAVVAAGSVVRCDVPAGMLAMGNPARVMSQALAVT